MESEAIQEDLQNLDVELKDVQGQISALIEHQDRLYERKSELKTLLKALAASGSPVASSGGSSAIENWSETFEWDSRADDVRFNVFGISKYRANQKEVSDFLYFLILNMILVSAFARNSFDVPFVDSLNDMSRLLTL
jgi:ATP-dependent DNA helicase Q1